ncbi:carbamoyl-phosphate synthase (glutamine-hydrolyzing) large subunit [Exiguobacterium acetylicum]|uniref:carbamoyl-phosphate synthase (glutamine-hydrolyzing) large subunit n=1 Tax=Exiguobacterium acetylicum TaxID=41170 RepID=UPI0027E1F2DC|nr:carbamoyl-phosphate synthase (glutamine-hydrolyzing) large subunit [Exiguobacterium acetylicum]MDQ6468675.1 carbamoyl-phosphate synthase (glutamine-hydrolyzing) large subunit [Exiguobacterium acetylicum]
MWDKQKVLVIGSGPIVIGQAAEFDYSGTQACQALREAGCEVILMNSNPATIMTDPSTADHVYIEAMTLEKATAIIKQDRPSHLLATVGGQTALNLAMSLEEAGVLEQYGVELLGTSLETIRDGEDRERFKQKMIELAQPLPESQTIESLAELEEFMAVHGVPLVIRPAFTLGGTGGGIALTKDEARLLAQNGLQASPISQCLVEVSIAGYKEVEYEVMRDSADTTIIVCNMENIDPVGVHTGDSVVFAPIQSISDRMNQQLRTEARKIVSHLGVIGGCNIQFAIHPTEERYFVIEVNPRVSRSSALASKATGYPIAKLATRLALGERLDDCINPVTKETMASFEPTMDYITAKVPCFPFDLFTGSNRTLGTQMKATGESMAMGKTLEEALQKAWRGAGVEQSPLYPTWMKTAEAGVLWKEIKAPTDRRLLAMLALLDRQETTVEELVEQTKVQALFVKVLQRLVDQQQKIDLSNESSLKQTKMMGFTDEQIAFLTGVGAVDIEHLRKEKGILPVYHMIDTCAGEFKSATPYFYGNWSGQTEVTASTKKKVAVIGAGPIRIGQGIEFDYCSVHAVRALQASGYETIMINNNPETVSTDFEVADRLYVEPLTLEDVMHVLEAEDCQDVLVQFGGQTGIALASGLETAGYHLLGTTAAVIDQMEDRERFYQFLDDIGIDRIPGQEVATHEQMIEVATTIGYPVMIRPSYVIGGKGMHIIHDQEQLETIVSELAFPVLVDAYLQGKEIEVDCITDGTTTYVPILMEQLERAGVHSGDSTMILPPVSLSATVQSEVERIAQMIGQRMDYKGAYNIQFVLHDDQVYVLEINPRASRTLPIVAKVTGQPILQWAVQAAVGQAVALPTEQTKLNFHAVKTPVFSTLKLQGVDPKTGPVMRSTGETLQWTTDGLALERFIFDETTKRHLTARDIIVAGADTEAFGTGVALDETIDWAQCAIFYSHVTEEKTSREAALAAGVQVLTEPELAQYHLQAVEKSSYAIKPLHTWTEPIKEEVK